MPSKDIYHNCVKNALVKDGWTITHDPLNLKLGKKDMFVDLAAQKMLAAEKHGMKIAVEVKSFVGTSEIEDLRNAVGQYVLYRATLQKLEPDRIIYLAIRQKTFTDIFEEEVGQVIVEAEGIKLLVFDQNMEDIVQWIE